MSLIDKYLTWRKRWLENLDLPNERQKRKLERINKIFADKEEIRVRAAVDKLRAGLVYKGMTFTNGKGKAIPLQDNHIEFIQTDKYRLVPKREPGHFEGTEYIKGKETGEFNRVYEFKTVRYIDGVPQEPEYTE